MSEWRKGYCIWWARRCLRTCWSLCITITWTRWARCCFWLRSSRVRRTCGCCGPGCLRGYTPLFLLSPACRSGYSCLCVVRRWYMRYLVLLLSFLNSKKSSLKSLKMPLSIVSWLNPTRKSLRPKKVSKMVVWSMLDCYFSPTIAWKMYSVNSPNFMYFKGCSNLHSYIYLLLILTSTFFLAFQPLPQLLKKPHPPSLAYITHCLLVYLLNLVTNSFLTLMILSFLYLQTKKLSK